MHCDKFINTLDNPKLICIFSVFFFSFLPPEKQASPTTEDADEPMVVDDNSLDQTMSTDTDTGSLSRYAMPLHCHTSTASVLRNYRHNPLISGTSLQLSPVFASPSGCGDGDASSVASLDDSMPPGLTACDTDASSDSGIDDNSMVETRATTPQKKKDETEAATPILEETAAVPPAPPPLCAVDLKEPQPLGEQEQELVEESSIVTSRKSSISFMDSSNPLLRTPYWMDLCNDDYNMSGATFEFSDNQLETVLGWSEMP